MGFRLSTGDELFKESFSGGLFDVRYCPQKDKKIKQNHNNNETEFDLSHLGTCLGSSIDRKFHVYSVGEGRKMGRIAPARTGGVTCIKHYGNLVLAGGDDGDVVVFEEDELKEVKVFHDEEWGIVYEVILYEEKLLTAVTGRNRSYIAVWDYHTTKRLYTVTISEKIPVRILSMAVWEENIYVCTAEDVVLIRIGKTLKNETKKCVVQ
eukprot:TRINITY_DN2697_c0_g1_i1.p1 TRINITY_DN2697_c0_g1~~TRINITY_DN2697_c0_g1_i1.p1  ORF type:complete len:208 (-),score=47.81 TRINITY_DN2697_c0_g1_i1:6-629(-)